CAREGAFRRNNRFDVW
nr:immunoglobulin heavy chain junction region [Macaca mulatta]